MDEAGNFFTTSHQRVLRDAVQFGAFGTMLTSSSVVGGQEFINYFRMQIPVDWDTGHLSYVVIVYSKSGSKYLI
jgi:hypothetical protein